jgi:predicted SprT family Zn-dependent metalloprotease
MIDADHPFQCSGCQNRYREARYAARCHKARSTDLRDGSVYVFSEEGEEAFLAADRARWAEEDKAYHYGCSCGESYRSIQAARDCRKCRTYTEIGGCTEVYDLNTGEILWRLNG